jgi:cytochrome c oxidase assembly protein subunit 15
VNSGLHRLALIASIVALVVIVLGAYVRLSHAGLGCPDWPGCYGQLTWPVEATEVEQANRAFPDRPVESGKAWKEMVHRYLAGALVLLVLGINFMAWKTQRVRSRVRVLAAVLLGLILFQAALGMWTVTLKLLPIVVMGHLMGGLTTFGMLLWITWQTSDEPDGDSGGAFTPFRAMILTSLGVLVLQLALGGWTSANYSALACPDFPTCQGVMMPDSNFRDGFILWREIGVDYEGGVLDLPSRTAIHMAHRIGALVTFLLLGILALRLVRLPACRKGGTVLAALLLGQVTLGILNVIMFLPLPIAVAHNATGALLLAAMLWLTHRSGLRYS